MTGRDRVGISGEMKINLLHRDHLRTTASRTPTLNPEYRTE